jgi:hypothetical protein
MRANQDSFIEDYIPYISRASAPSLVIMLLKNEFLLIPSLNIPTKYRVSLKNFPE